jgi:apolipoprotein N-acyltransferase
MRLAAAVTTGLGLVLAFPGPDLGPVAFVALVPLLVAVETMRPRVAAGLGLLAGLVFFGVHLRWIEVFGNLAWASLSIAQALFVAAFFALVPATRRLGGWRVALLPACWAALELARAHGPLGGFPWGVLGLSQHDGGPLLPLARVVGAYGLSAVIVAVNLALAIAVRTALGAGRRETRQAGAPADAPWRRPAVALAWVVLAAALPLAGLAAPAAPPVDGPSLDVVAVQGNVPGRGRADRLGQEALADAETFANHVAATTRLADDRPPPDLVVWGEGAVNDDPFAHPALLEGIREAAGAAGAPLLLGASTDVPPDRVANEALLFTSGGVLADRYVKRRLVPFGEYVPGGATMRRLLPVTNEAGRDRAPGRRLEPMMVDGIRFGTIICWESAYAEDPRRLARDGARFLVVLTNNSSWGLAPGSRQHLATSQLRAVETGRTVVHAAVSGISAVVGPDGVARQRTGLYEAATVRAAVAPRSGLTVYTRFGRLVEAVLLGLAVATLAAVALTGQRVGVPSDTGRAVPGPQPAASRGGP